mgnify:FL=1
MQSLKLTSKVSASTYQMQQTQFEPYEPMTLAPQDLDSGSGFKGQRGAHLSYAFRCKFCCSLFLRARFSEAWFQNDRNRIDMDRVVLPRERKFGFSILVISWKLPYLRHCGCVSPVIILERGSPIQTNKAILPVQRMALLPLSNGKLPSQILT